MAGPKESERPNFMGYREHLRANEEYIVKYTPWGTLKLLRCRCVYEPSDDTELVLEALKELDLNDVHEVLDLGTGTGIIAKVLDEFIKVPKVVAVDISPYATQCARANLSNRVLVVACDTARCIKDKSFDLVVLNPPYLPLSEGPLKDDCEKWLEVSWSTTASKLRRLCKDSLRVTRKLFIGVYSSLSPINLARCVTSGSFKIIGVKRRKFFFEEIKVIVAWRKLR